MRNASPCERCWTVCKKGNQVLRNHPVFVLVCEPVAIVYYYVGFSLEATWTRVLLEMNLFL